MNNTANNTKGGTFDSNKQTKLRKLTKQKVNAVSQFICMAKSFSF